MRVFLAQYLQMLNTGGHSAVVVDPQRFVGLSVGRLAAAVGEMRDQNTRKVFPAAYAFINLPLVAVQRPGYRCKSTCRLA